MSKLSGEMRDLINPEYLQGLPQVRQLMNAWEKIATPKALKHTDNIVFSNRKKHPAILIYVDSSHWAAELGNQKELYRTLLEKETKSTVDDLIFLVTQKKEYRKVFIKNRDGSTALVEPAEQVCLTKEEDGYARDMVSGIKDENLKEKLYNAVKADLERKKGSGCLKLPELPPESPETI